MSIPIIDTDTHVIEAADVWTKRLPAKWRDQTMQVRWSDKTQHEMWCIGERPFKRAWENVSYKVSGDGEREQVVDERWAPPTLAEAHPSAHLPRERVAIMDDWGIKLSVLYPNSAGFALEPFLDHPNPEISLAHVRAYNDYQIEEWVGSAPGRFIPMMALPYWDVPAAVAEIERLADSGFGGVVMTGAPQQHDQPHLISRHWDPMWRACEEADLSVSFHVANGTLSGGQAGPAVNEHHLRVSMRLGTASYLDNARQTVDLISSGILARFPKLRFVISESGIGWVPFVLDALDSRFVRDNIRRVLPEFGDLLPSDLFRRQVFVNFWFEHLEDFHIEKIGIGNLLWETDFPHPTGLYYSDIADVIDQALGGHPDQVKEQVLWKNPARLYSRALEKQGVLSGASV
ncbi:amidohydrolase family protein [Amycolatopsis sp. GM8]|uniref:amidohydrolase family protein n=1 Tax=Amycolatopsis sp. GM8 TaxID=2896530 RepID=UPI001F1EFD47|nr:amidohydrolase family protein [Amycolatopsis sp. GM8]